MKLKELEEYPHIVVALILRIPPEAVENLTEYINSEVGKVVYIRKSPPYVKLKIVEVLPSGKGRNHE